MSVLPVDPTNTSSSRLYYTYITNSTQFELTSAMESVKYNPGGSGDVISPDGGPLASIYEKGTKLGLEPVDYGNSSLIDYWPLNEGTGTIAYDDSGSNVTGTWNGTANGTSGYYSAGNGQQALAGYFNGSNDYISVPALNIFNEGAFTVTGWMYPTVSKEDEGLFGVCQSQTTDHCLHLAIRSGTPYMGFFGDDISSGTTALNTWYNFAFTYTGGAGGTRSIYLNGVLLVSGTSAAGLQVANGTTGEIGSDIIEGNTQGMIQDVRVYNKVLSASAIQAIYTGGK
jgi:hypothetical protein